MAKLYFRYAVMNAGKSTQLLQIAYDYEKNNNRNILCLKPSIDNKADDYIISRLENGTIKRKVDFLIQPQEGWLKNRIMDYVSDENKKPAIILIDEAQFLSEANVWELAGIVAYQSIPIICFGLKVDAFGKPFIGSSTLFALAQDIEEVTTRAICRYSKAAKKATFQIRIINDKPVFEGEQVAIEDDVDIKYQPACLEKYIKLRDEILGAKE